MVKVDYGIDIHEFLMEARHLPVLDVRTPAEFSKGHMPGAISFPLFEDEERARIGTLYNHTGSDAAILLGLEIIGPRLRDYAEKARLVAPAGKALLYCWRGGMRSNSLAWLLSTSGMDCKTLQGGYKSYRRHILEKLSEPRKYILIGGKTGCGKTDLLHIIRSHGEQVIDMEALASHKGSAFGAVGLDPQPSQESFENELFASWNDLDPERIIWMEDESIRIGMLFIPNLLFERMKKSPVIQIHTSSESRLERLIRDYARVKPEMLSEVFMNLKKRLGDERTKLAISYLEKKDFANAALIALQHYDKVYEKQLEQKGALIVKQFDLDNKSLNNSALSIIEWSRELNSF